MTAVFNPSMRGGTNAFQFNREAAHSQSISVVSSPENLNGGRFDHVIISAPHANPFGHSPGVS